MKKILSPMEKIRFPESEELPEGVKEIDVKDTFGYCTELYSDVEYAEHSGRKLHLQIMAPLVYGKDLKWPLIVYVQGSSWHKQKLFQSLPTLVRMCERGYAVAIVEHRESELAPFPAQVIDIKAAIRFLRMNGAHYGINVSKVVLWGDSSGAHTALMAGITGDAEYLPEKYPQTTTEVDCIIDWFGPTDLMAASQYPSAIDHDSAKSPSGVLIGGKTLHDHPEDAYPANPVVHLHRNRKTPPVLIMHGGSDPLVPFNQSCILYEALKRMDKDVEFVKLRNAGHGWGGFMSEAALDIVEEFIKKKIN
ncbi:alpha/beta hydrolase fold domain-containing protein [Blautia sp.]|uniref:alpha/beta hydrolase fold domain-containing protein n=1 Tax=Blautia sp. TaxID=1955243 RepID=UPI003AB66148